MSLNTVESLIEEGKRIIEEKRDKYAQLEGVSEESVIEDNKRLQQERALCIEEKARIESNATSTRLSDSLIVAATVDTCLSRVVAKGDFAPEHIFLDEAGYCSLIKVGTLFVHDCPITFLGDHMQLPPVCEMNDDTMRRSKAVFSALWAQSALYVEDIFTSSPEDVCSDYLNHEPASFCLMKKYDLTHSFRFGESLAKVLSSCVYQNGFHGDSDHDTDIFYINAKKSTGGKLRTSMSECRAIKAYIDSHLDENIGVITPYANQRANIKLLLGKYSNMDDDVVTVHGSQGREWDTVLFSVVDTYDKWFTDSNNKKSNGKNVINTAVSRARKKLIIVCDVDKWITQKEQLIGQLLSVAQEITNTYEG